jgi:hypothetical protein
MSRYLPMTFFDLMIIFSARHFDPDHYRERSLLNFMLPELCEISPIVEMTLRRMIHLQITFFNLIIIPGERHLHFFLWSKGGNSK